jgi:enoyl-CoA hydratase/carnithine racemase
MDAEEALRHNLANYVMPRDEVVSSAVSFVAKTAFINPDIMMLGRDLYHAMRGVPPEQAVYQARFSLGVALGVPYKK